MHLEKSSAAVACNDRVIKRQSFCRSYGWLMPGGQHLNKLPVPLIHDEASWTECGTDAWTKEVTADARTRYNVVM